MESYDVFISYSRLASTCEARAIRKGIRSYNKAWNASQSTRVFLDDESLSASSSLSGTIESALSQAKWMIILLTAEAAESKWVNSEVEWWVTNRSTDHLLLVHAGGTLGWKNHDFDPASTAVPPSLRGRLKEEPRWTDMTWFATSEGEADPRFVDKVIELYCPIHGLTRDEAVAQHDVKLRRTKRAIWAAFSIIATLLVLALVSAGMAVRQRNNANDKARIATARQLAARSQQLVSTDVGTARLLAAQAYSMEDDDQTRGALLGSLTRSPELAGQTRVPAEVAAMAGATDGSVVYLGLIDGTLLRWRPADKALDALGDIGERVVKINTSDDGRVAVAQTQRSDDTNSEVSVWIDGQRAPIPDSATSAPASTVSPSGDTVTWVDDAGVLHASTVEAGRLASPKKIGPIGPSVKQLGMMDDTTVTVLQCCEIEATATYRLSPFALAVRSGFTLPSDPVQNYYLSRSGAVFYNQPVVASTHGKQVGVGAWSVGNDVDLFSPSAISPDGTLFAWAQSGDLHLVRPKESSGNPSVENLGGSGSIDHLAVLSSSIIVSSESTLVSLRDMNRKSPLVAENSAPISVAYSWDWPARPIYVSPSGGNLAFGHPEGVAGDVDGIVSRKSEKFTELDARFLAWRSEDEFFTADNDRIQLRRMGEKQPIREWRSAVDLGDVKAGLPTFSQAVWVEGEKSLIILLNSPSPSRLMTLDTEEGSFSDLEVDGGYSISSLSSDGSLFLASNRGVAPPSWQLRDRKSGSELKGVLEYKQTDQGLSSFAFVDDHSLVEIGSSHDRLLANGPTPAVTVPKMMLATVPVSWDRRYMILAPKPDAIRISSRSTGTEIGEFPVQNRGTALAVNAGFSADSLTAASVTNSPDRYPGSIVTFYDLRPQSWMSAVCDSVRRPLTLAEWTLVTGQGAPAQLACA